MIHHFPHSGRFTAALALALALPLCGSIAQADEPKEKTKDPPPAEVKRPDAAHPPFARGEEFRRRMAQRRERFQAGEPDRAKSPPERIASLERKLDMLLREVRALRMQIAQRGRASFRAFSFHRYGPPGVGDRRGDRGGPPPWAHRGQRPGGPPWAEAPKGPRRPGGPPSADRGRKPEAPPSAERGEGPPRHGPPPPAGRGASPAGPPSAERAEGPGRHAPPPRVH